jgi:hypothetical protein
VRARCFWLASQRQEKSALTGAIFLSLDEFLLVKVMTAAFV